MANKKCLVLHPKLNMFVDGKFERAVKGEEISIDADTAKKMIASGKLELVVAKKANKKPKAKAKAKKDAETTEGSEGAEGPEDSK